MNKTKGRVGCDEKWNFITSTEEDIPSMSFIFAKNAVQIPKSFLRDNFFVHATKKYEYF